MKISTQLVPAFASTRLARLAFGVGLGAVAIALTSAVLPQSATAQSAADAASPIQDFISPQNERDSFGGSIGGGGNFSVFDLMHNAQGGGTIDANQFSQEKNQEIDRAAEEYRRLQLQRLNQQPGAPVNAEPQSQQAN